MSPPDQAPFEQASSTALVPGASRGIGRAIALALANEGYGVAVTARTVVEGTSDAGLLGSLQSTAAAIEAAGQRALKAMVERGQGTIINVTSGAGISDPPAPIGWALGYGCAKGGFHRMAGVVAVELGDRGIRCYNLEPGFVATERVQARSNLAWVAVRGKSPEVVGAVAAWLLRQPDGTVRNGSMVSTDEVARQLGLLATESTVS